MSQTNVLLVSAEPADQSSIREALDAVRGQPYRLDTVDTLADALAALRGGRVEAIVLSLSLPDSLGITTFLRLQPKATSIPIVALVAERDEAGVGLQNVSPPEGLQYQQIQSSYVATGGAGVYQVVTGCTSGANYRIQGSFRTNSASGRSAGRSARTR